MTEAPKPILMLIGFVALILIAGEFYLGYYAFTAPASYEQPAVASAPVQPAPPTQGALAQPPPT